MKETHVQGKYVLALDQGTTGSRAFLFDRKGAIVASAYREFPQYFPKPGWVEHDAEEIWASCQRVIREAVRKASIHPSEIAAIGITNQRETTVMWDRTTSRPVARAIVWQCRRTAEICQKLKKHEEIFRKKTGLVLDPYFSGTKIQWFLDQIPGLRAKTNRAEICFGTVDSWLIWKLTNGRSHTTDYTNASRTLIFNIRTKRFDRELLQLLKIPAAILPKVQASGSVFGYTRNQKSLLPDGIAISGVMGDQQAALYGQGCHAPGAIKSTYGTGCFLLLNTGKKCVSSQRGLLTTLASDERGWPVYALEGAVFVAGAAIQWLRDQLQILSTSKNSERLVAGLKDTNGVYFVPAFTGLGAPYWDAQARGAILGLTRGANRKHVTRAALESIAYQTKDVFDVMEKESGRRIRELKVDGGAAQNKFLMQFQADMLNCRLLRPKAIESTAQGAAYLAGVAVGLWKTPPINNRQVKIFYPRMNEKCRRKLYGGWQAAVKTTQSHRGARSSKACY